MSTLLLHSVSYAGLWGQPALNTEQFIDKAAELGFGGIMLAAKRPQSGRPQTLPQNGRRVAAELQQCG